MTPMNIFILIGAVFIVAVLTLFLIAVEGWEDEQHGFRYGKPGDDE